MKKLFIGLLTLGSISTFAADCTSLVGEYLCTTKYRKETIQIEKTHDGYTAVETNLTWSPFSEPNSKSYFDPECVANNKLEYKESYFLETFFVKITPSSNGIQVEKGFVGAKETGFVNCVRE